MASVFRRRGRDGKPSKVWWFKFRDERGQWRTRKGWPSKTHTEEHALAVEADCRAVRNGEKAPPTVWQAAQRRPIQDVIQAYLGWGRTQGGKGGRPWESRHAAKKEQWLAWWVDELGLRVLGDVNLEAVERVIQGALARWAGKSVALRVEALKSLLSWAVRRKESAALPPAERLGEDRHAAPAGVQDAET